MKLTILAVVMTAFISCEPQKPKYEPKIIIKDTSIHNIDTLFEYFSKRYTRGR